jgi:hypothetical protein
MKRHRLHTGGLKRAFVELHRRHHEPPELACLRRIPWYLRNGTAFAKRSKTLWRMRVFLDRLSRPSWTGYARPTLIVKSSMPSDGDT